MPGGDQLKIYTDGRCPFCLWSRALVEPYDTEGRLQFLDYNDPVIRAKTPFALGELDREMHVLAPDGRWHVGYAGWVCMLSALPRWRRLARLLGLRPLRFMGSALYRWIARHRYRLPQFLYRALGIPRPCDQGCQVRAA